MLQIKQSESTAARRRVPVYLVDATDGVTPETGITFAAGDIKLSKNGAAEGNHAGTVTELAGGLYSYEATAGEVDTLGFLSARFTKSGVRTFVAVAQVQVLDPYTAAGGSAPTAADVADAVWDEARSGHTAAGSFGQGVAGVLGNVTGSVASVTGAVGSVTAPVSAKLTTTSEDAVVDKVWNEARVGHTTAGTFGAVPGCARCPRSPAAAAGPRRRRLPMPSGTRRARTMWPRGRSARGCRACRATSPAPPAPRRR